MTRVIRHSSFGAGAYGRHRRHAAHAQVSAQRGTRPLGVLDARTRVEHLMSDESAMAHRHSGRYVALCGVEVLAASLTAPEHSRCGPCQEGVS